MRGREVSPAGSGVRPEGPVSLTVGIRTGSGLSTEHKLPTGEEEKDLVFLCVCVCRGVDLVGERCPLWGGSASLQKGTQSNCLQATYLIVVFVESSPKM